MVGIAIGLGINPALAAGAVVAGAYTGDKMSPMSGYDQHGASCIRLQRL